MAVCWACPPQAAYPYKYTLEGDTNIIMTPLTCMALALYFEARSEPLDAQLAVAEVILNRVEDTRFPDDVCGVVWQPKQFSWTHDGLTDTPKNKEVWDEIKDLCDDVLSDPDSILLGHGADHYHATYVDPYWSSDLTVVGLYGTHVFYKWER